MYSRPPKFEIARGRGLKCLVSEKGTSEKHTPDQELARAGDYFSDVLRRFCCQFDEVFVADPGCFQRTKICTEELYDERKLRV